MPGQASAVMTPDRHGHLSGEQLDAVTDRMDAARADGMRTDGGSAPVRPLGSGAGQALTCQYANAPGGFRNCDTRFRKPIQACS